MKTNPWMIVSLVLACVCGFLVGLLVSQPSEVSAAPKKDWIYHTQITETRGKEGIFLAVRWDRNEENPHPEFFNIDMYDKTWRKDYTDGVRRWRPISGKEEESNK